MKITGRAIRLGDNIDTDVIIPTQHMTLPSVADMVRYAFEPIWPGFAEFVRPKDVLVAGRNFGSGSSREQASEIIKALGFACVVAESFSRLFYRNALNNGLLVIESADFPPAVETGVTVNVDTENCLLRTSGVEVPFGRVPERLMDMVRSGGLVKYWKSVNSLSLQEHDL